ncbi:MAG: glutathione S-transferase family protein [Burkholderiaceae bacterium]
MYELYFAPGACSFVPHAALEIIREKTGDDFVAHRVKLHKGEQFAPDYLALNPNGQVPVLIADGQPLTQILAICNRLDAAYPQLSLMPAEQPARSHALSLLAWMNNTVHPCFTRIFRASKFAESESAQAEVKALGVQDFRQQLERLDSMVPEQGFLAGNKQPGFADAYSFTLLRWSGIAGINPASLPRLLALVERVCQNPAIARALATERVGLDTFKG